MVDKVGMCRFIMAFFPFTPDVSCQSSYRPPGTLSKMLHYAGIGPVPGTVSTATDQPRQHLEVGTTSEFPHPHATIRTIFMHV